MQRFLPNAKITKKTLVNTSYFFRDTNEYEFKLIEYYKRYRHPLKILVAGCATGQEPYSIAIICEVNGIPCQVYAFDLSNKAIAFAKNGIYNATNERNLILRSGKEDVLNLLDKYSSNFVLNNNKITVSQFIKDKVVFLENNVLDIDYSNEFDFVFGRKMLYYLPHSIVSKAIVNLKRALKNNLDEQNLVIDGFSKRVLKKHLN